MTGRCLQVVGPEQIAEVVSRWTGIPVNRLTQSEKDKILQLAERLHAQVIGQDGPISAVANAVLRTRAGMGNESRPTGCFMFLGPSGVGKTETVSSPFSLEPLSAAFPPRDMYLGISFRV